MLYVIGLGPGKEELFYIKRTVGAQSGLWGILLAGAFDQRSCKDKVVATMRHEAEHILKKPLISLMKLEKKC